MANTKNTNMFRFEWPGLILLMIVVLVFGFFLGWTIAPTDQEENSEQIESEQSYSIFDTSEFTEERIFLGNEEAENEVIFVLDYACPFCKEWVEEVYSPLKEAFIDTGKVRFYTLPQVYLSKETLALTEFTEKLARSYPEEHFNVVNKIYETHEKDEWGSEAFIHELAEEFELENWEDVQLDYDVIRQTRQVTRGLEVEVVPSVYVNGRMVKDRMDYEEISRLIEETEPAAWTSDGDSCDEDDEC